MTCSNRPITPSPDPTILRRISIPSLQAEKQAINSTHTGFEHESVLPKSSFSASAALQSFALPLLVETSPLTPERGLLEFVSSPVASRQRLRLSKRPALRVSVPKSFQEPSQRVTDPSLRHDTPAPSEPRSGTFISLPGPSLRSQVQEDSLCNTPRCAQQHAQDILDPSSLQTAPAPVEPFCGTHMLSSGPPSSPLVPENSFRAPNHTQVLSQSISIPPSLQAVQAMSENRQGASPSSLVPSVHLQVPENASNASKASKGIPIAFPIRICHRPYRRS
ncbi:hypothetical protein BD779DRAFT_1033715 [Infundibulicybe gibba]|nr:hypothetical protein BD779DRAFT_1033715 [Infundibulicybe gibba]